MREISLNDEMKPVKCKYCAEQIGERKQNDFRPLGGGWQRHKRSFPLECPKCHEWQMFAVNENNPKININTVITTKFSLQNV
jgi:endogenous inhibitor of DNA gyrase (YacG/DUF329 family)